MGFRSSRPRVDAHDRVLRVVFSPKELLDLGGLDILAQFFQMFLEIFRDRLTLLGPLDESADFLLAAVEMIDEVQIVLEATSFSGKLLSLGGVGPNSGIGQFLL